MRVGLTFDLREDYLARGFGEEETAELDSPRTIEAIEEELARLGYTADRIGGIESLVRRLAGGERWDLVFNIAEGLFGRAREAQVPALLDAYRIPYTFSDALTLAIALDKALTKRVVRDAGVPTPRFAVLEDPGRAAEVDLEPPLFVKPVAEGSGKGVGPRSVCESRDSLRAAVADVVGRFGQPALVEEYLPGREFTVGILGTGDDARSLGVMEVEFVDRGADSTYGYDIKQDWETRVRYRLVSGPVSDEAADVALRAWRALGCRDGGRLDLRTGSDGSVQFLEVNPLAGLNPDTSDLPILCRLGGMTFGALIDGIMKSAMARVRSR